MFRYTIDFPTNNVPASKILRNLGVKKFKYVGFGSSKKYISLEHGYEISFDHDMGFVQFNKELQNKIGAIMDQITDIVGAQRGDYTIMDNETNEEVCLDALNDEYPSSKFKSFRYYVRLYPNTAKPIQQAIMIAHPNIVLTDDQKEYKCEQFLMDIDGLDSVGFYFDDVCRINSTIYPVMKALNYKSFDYVVEWMDDGDKIKCEAHPECNYSSSEAHSEDYYNEVQDDESTCSSYCSSFEFHQAAAEKQDEDEVSNCSSYEFGRVTADEAEEWLAEMKLEQQQNYAVKYEIESDDEARIDDDSDDEWLPPAEQRQKHKASVQKKAENKSLKQRQKVARWFERAQKKANRTEQEKVAYAAKVDAIIADRRAKKVARLQAEQERLQAQKEKIQAVLERFEAEAEKEKQDKIQKKLQRLHRQLN
jgi:hypothetical protein